MASRRALRSLADKRPRGSCAEIRGRGRSSGGCSEAAGNELRVRIASGVGERHHVVQAMRPAGSPAQAVEAHAMLRVVMSGRRAGVPHEIKLVQIDLAL